MQRKYAIILIVIIFSIFFVPKIFRISPQGPREIHVNGKYVVINYGKHHIAAKRDSQTRESFLINNGFVSKSGFAYFFAIPFDKVKELEKQYGDFMHCGSPGAAAGQASIVTIILFTNDLYIENKINEVLQLRLNSPLIEITASRLNITEHMADKEKYEAFDRSMQEIYYLVNDVLITQRRYQ